MMENTAQHYWELVYSNYFHEDHNELYDALETAERLLSKAYFSHLKELVEGDAK